MAFSQKVVVRASDHTLTARDLPLGASLPGMRPTSPQIAVCQGCPRRIVRHARTHAAHGSLLEGFDT